MSTAVNSNREQTPFPLSSECSPGIYSKRKRSESFGSGSEQEFSSPTLLNFSSSPSEEDLESRDRFKRPRLDSLDTLSETYSSTSDLSQRAKHLGELGSNQISHVDTCGHASTAIHGTECGLTQANEQYRTAIEGRLAALEGRFQGHAACSKVFHKHTMDTAEFETSSTLRSLDKQIFSLANGEGRLKERIEKLEGASTDAAELAKKTEQFIGSQLQTIKQDFELKLSNGLERVREDYNPRELKKDNKLILQRTLKLADAAIAQKGEVDELKSLVHSQRAEGEAFKTTYEKQKEDFIRHNEEMKKKSEKMCEKAEVNRLGSELRLLRRDQERGQLSTQKTDEKVNAMIEEYHAMKKQGEKMCEKRQLDELRSELLVLQQQQQQAELFKRNMTQRMTYLLSKPWLANQGNGNCELRSEVRLLRRQIEEEKAISIKSKERINVLEENTRFLRAHCIKSKERINDLEKKINYLRAQRSQQSAEAVENKQALKEVVSQISAMEAQLSHHKTRDDQMKVLVQQNKQQADEILESKKTLATVVSQLSSLQAQFIAQKVGTENPVASDVPVANRRSSRKG
ncbi:hypothetical protein V8E51_010702 [Hyaloscypha variabilis]